jgi:multidrug efflux pump subunit AcrA (membrane-fusion protein)
MSKHTPAPWNIFDDDRNESKEIFVREGGLEKVIATLGIGFSEPFESQQQANAKLIAAAPELLAAAERSLNWLSSYPGGNATSAYDQMRAAIDKATK